MIAFLVAGLIVGVLARVLRSGPDQPSAVLTVLVGVVGAVVGGVGMNLLMSDPWTDLNAFAFAAACIVGIVLIGLLEGGVGRRE
jgi:uncharacterized membrane protein YeaQ/YmgE (transglycosylase-associated protein family)